MNKQFTIEVPLYAYPVKYLADVQEKTNINIILYGGMPNSPLNGGRFNYSIDGFPLHDRFFHKINKSQLERLTNAFYKSIDSANKKGIPFFIAFTNMFVKEDELTPENLKPIEFLMNHFHKHGVKNGVIVNNPLLEDFLRDKYKEDILFVSSCTKYVSPQRILNPEETIPLYIADSGKYDYVVLTPQDSRREKVIVDVLSQSKGKIIAICNSYCADQCNSYHHYLYMSQENKKSILDLKTMDLLKNSYNFLIKRSTTCSAFRYQFQKIDVEKLATRQLDAGIINFKIGRGLGTKCLDQVVSLIQNHCSIQ